MIAAWLARRYGLEAAARITRAAWWLLALAVVAAFWVGYALFWYRHGVSVAENRARLAITEMKLANEAALAEQRRDALIELQGAVALGERLSAEVNRLQGQRTDTVRTIIKRIPDVTTIYVPTPGAAAEALPACPFTVGYQRLWNAALATDRLRADPGASAAGVDAETGAAADPAEPADATLTIAAGVTPAALLENHTLNAERCAGIEDDHAALIQWLRARHTEKSDR